MNANAVEIEPKEHICLLNKLSRLLEEQINIMRHSGMDSRQIEYFSQQSELIVIKIVESGILELDETKKQREHLRRLYDALNLAIIARKEETEKKIKQVHKGKKTLSTYSSNM
jgi:hypothetical protein